MEHQGCMLGELSTILYFFPFPCQSYCDLHLLPKSLVLVNSLFFFLVKNSLVFSVCFVCLLFFFFLSGYSRFLLPAPTPRKEFQGLGGLLISPLA